MIWTSSKVIFISYNPTTVRQREMLAFLAAFCNVSSADRGPESPDSMSQLYTLCNSSMEWC